MKRIGIMGGTFNPIHNGHIEIAKAAYKQFSLDKVFFLPAKRPPHKRNQNIADDNARIQMIDVAIRPYPYFTVSTCEMEREKFSYTADTLRELSEKYPESELYFIVGADSLHYMEEWREPDVIFKLAHILSAPRFPITNEEDFAYKAYLEKSFGAKIDFIKMTPINISSSEILAELKKGNFLEEQLPEGVADFIRSNKLYSLVERKDTSSMTYNEINSQLQKVLPRKRYEHTLGVADTAACLAMCYGEDIQRARITGMLHDCAKCLPDDEILKQCEKRGLIITETQRKMPFLLHGMLGACYAKERYGVTDEEMLHAIEFHTTGHPNMTLLEKIIFLADYIEPGRKQIPGLDFIRSTAFTDLDRAIYQTLKNTLKYLMSEENQTSEIDEMTEKSYAYYRELIENRKS